MLSSLSHTFFLIMEELSLPPLFFCGSSLASIYHNGAFLRSYFPWEPNSNWVDPYFLTVLLQILWICCAGRYKDMTRYPTPLLWNVITIIPKNGSPMLVLTQYITLGWLMPCNENLALCHFLKWIFVSHALVKDISTSLANTEYYFPHDGDFWSCQWKKY